MRVGVVVFPGSNCDHDAYHVVKHVLGAEVRFLWHKDPDLAGVERLILPGGFSYGDYLRAGALARFSPVMALVRRFADQGGPVLGICNGFQILCEAGLLAGALGRNARLQFSCRDVHVRVETERSALTHGLRPGTVLKLPIAHAEGCFTLGEPALDALERAGQVVFRYSDADGALDASDGARNPNGSCRSIAGICNALGNVVGLMPHPERASEEILGNTAGRELLRAFVS